MIGHIKSWLRPFISTATLSQYHRALSWLAAEWYGHPSEKMIVIGVTGTKGKTSTSYLLAKILEASGKKVGLTSTAFFKINEREWLNTFKMTMLGRFALQRLLHDMLEAGCTHVVVETSSEGIVQHRHRGVAYDLALLTNLTPEHIESHGSFEAYRLAKAELFRTLVGKEKKALPGAPEKTSIVNAQSADAAFFLDIPVAKRATFAIDRPAEYCAQDVSVAGITTFRINDVPFRTALPGMVNVWNLVAASSAAAELGVSLAVAAQAVEKIVQIPGRFERIVAGQPFTAVVDYAYEPESLTQLFVVLDTMPHQRLIHVFGATGGGRDSWRRPVMGEISAAQADISIVTTDDPYDDDPAELNRQVMGGMSAKKINESLFEIVDRRAAIAKAVALAQPNDLVVVTGKGSEQVMALAHGQKIPWDDRIILREEIEKKYGTHSTSTP